MQVVSDAILRSTSAASSDRVAGSESAKMTRLPEWITASAVARKVFVGTITELPSIPSDLIITSNAAVPLLTAAQCRDPA